MNYNKKWWIALFAALCFASLRTTDNENTEKE